MTSRSTTVTHRTFTPPRAIGRVLQVVKLLAQKARPMSLAELCGEFDVPRTSLFAILKGLEREGYVTFEREAYSLGPESLRLGQSITRGQSFPSAAAPVLEDMGRLSGETVILCTLSEDRRHVVYSLVQEAESALRFSVKAGAVKPLSASASGHAVLAHLPTAEREAYLKSGPFKRFTPGTLTSVAELRQAVSRTRREHCAMTIDGTVLAAIGIAAPFFGSQGEVKGALVIAGPTSRMIDRQTELKALAIQGGESISRLLGFEADYPPPPP